MSKASSTPSSKGTPYRPSKDEKEEIRAQFEQDKSEGLSFKQALEKLNAEREPDLRLGESAAYALWPKNSVSATTTSSASGENVSEEDPSVKLAGLLKKEGQLRTQVKKLQSELAAVESEVAKLWEARSSESVADEE